MLDGGELKFDFIEKINPDGNFSTAGFVTLNGASGMQAQLDIIPGDPGNAWTTFSTPLTAAAWGETQSDWENIIGDIASILVNVESGAEITETIGFDNFSVDVVAPIPVPASWPLLAVGLGLFGVIGARRRTS